MKNSMEEVNLENELDIEKARKVGRVKTPILLTEKELRSLEKMIHRSGTNRSFILQEAVQLGLRDAHKLAFEGRRNHRINVWLPEESLRAVTQIAKQHNASKQSVLRLFLRHYRRHSSGTTSSKTKEYTQR